MKKYLLIFSIFFLSTCSVMNVTPDQLDPNIRFKKLEKIVKNNNFKFNYLSGKIRVIYNNQNVTANIRIKQDSIIWVSLTMFGIEGARLIITQDHFEMTNKFKREYYKKPLSYIEKYFPIKLDYKLIEQLIIGNFIENGIKKQKIETKQEKYIVKGNIENLDVLYTILYNGKIDSIDIHNIRKDEHVLMSQSKYEGLNDQQFSTRRKFIIEDVKGKKLLDLKFYKMKFEKIDFPFIKPESYIEK